MKKTIGVLGGMGPLATADLFRKIALLTKAACDNDHIRVYIDSNAQIPDRTAAILSGGESPLQEMTDALDNLENLGASCIVMPCNTAHYFLPDLQKLTKIPFVSMLEATAKACAAQFPGKTAGILATKGTLATSLYTDALHNAGVASIMPDSLGQDALMTAIYDVVKAGKDLELCRGIFEEILKTMAGQGADYFILGCTELPILWDGIHPDFQAIDPTTELAKAAIRFCGYETL
ncbi:MAG: amino acid racemase [Eubacteriales bacterium]